MGNSLFKWTLLIAEVLHQPLLWLSFPPAQQGALCVTPLQVWGVALFHWVDPPVVQRVWMPVKDFPEQEGRLWFPFLQGGHILYFIRHILSLIQSMWMFNSMEFDGFYRWNFPKIHFLLVLISHLWSIGDVCQTPESGEGCSHVVCLIDHTLYHTTPGGYLFPDAAGEKTVSLREDNGITAPPRSGCLLSAFQEPCRWTDLNLTPASHLLAVWWWASFWSLLICKMGRIIFKWQSCCEG